MLLKFETEEQWLKQRLLDVTSTEVSSLFGLSRYKSRLRLWHEKNGDIEPDDLDDNPFAKWGRRLEIPVGLGICEDHGWDAETLTGLYFTFPYLRLGSSMDIRAICPERGAGILEVKVSDAFTEDQGWFEDKAPIEYEFQIQTQLHCAIKDGQEINWGAIGTLGRRQQSHLYPRQYDPELGALIDQEVEDFWKSIQKNQPPKPDYYIDSEILQSMMKEIREGDRIILTGNNRAHDLCVQYEDLIGEISPIKAELKDLEKRKKAIQAEIHELIGRNETAIIGDYQIGARMQETEDTIQYGYSFRRFDFKKTRKDRK